MELTKKERVSARLQVTAPSRVLPPTTSLVMLVVQKVLLGSAALLVRVYTSYNQVLPWN